MRSGRGTSRRWPRRPEPDRELEAARGAVRNARGTGTLHIPDATFELLARGFESIDPDEWETIGPRADDGEDIFPDGYRSCEGESDE